MNQFAQAHRHWRATTSDKDYAVVAAFYDAMAACNAAPKFSAQADLYGFAQKGMATAINRLSGLRGNALQHVVDWIVATDDIRGIPFRLAELAKHPPVLR